MSYTIPSDTHASGDAGHTTDHNNLADLVALNTAVNILNTAYAGGADPAGAADSTSAINAAVTAATSSHRPVIIPAGTYKISSALNWKIAGLQVAGEGSQFTKIVQNTANTPIIQLAGQGQNISGLTLNYPTQQPSANTSAIGVQFGDDTVGSCFLSQFTDLYVQQAATGFAINPAITSAAGLFSCTFTNIHVLGYSVNGVSFIGSNGLGANCTGCVFNNIYVHNNWTGTDTGSTSWPVQFQGWDDLVINQLNVEHANVFNSDAAMFAKVDNVVINSCHFEHLELSGNPGWGFIGVGSNDGCITVNGMSLRFNTMTGTSYNSVFRIPSGSGAQQTIILNGYNEPSTDGGRTTPSHPFIDFGSATNVSMEIRGIDSSGPLTTADSVNAGAGSTVQKYTGAKLANPVQPSGGITTAQGAFTAFGTGGYANLLNVSSGASTTTVAGTWYYVALPVWFNATLTGALLAAGTTGGTDLWIAALWPAAGGAALASSAAAGTAAPAANTKAKFAFTTPYAAAGPAAYILGVQSNGTTAKLMTFPNATEGFITGSQAGTFGTIPSLTPAATYSQNIGPMAATY